VDTLLTFLHLLAFLHPLDFSEESEIAARAYGAVWTICHQSSSFLYLSKNQWRQSIQFNNA